MRSGRWRAQLRANTPRIIHQLLHVHVLTKVLHPHVSASNVRCQLLLQWHLLPLACRRRRPRTCVSRALRQDRGAGVADRTLRDHGRQHVFKIRNEAVQALAGLAGIKILGDVLAPAGRQRGTATRAGAARTFLQLSKL